jgi:hypothetical protein
MILLRNGETPRIREYYHQIQDINRRHRVDTTSSIMTCRHPCYYQENLRELFRLAHISLELQWAYKVLFWHKYKRSPCVMRSNQLQPKLGKAI